MANLTAGDAVTSTDGQDGGAPTTADRPASRPAAAPSIHRLRDLDRAERLWAGALLAAVLLAPVAALAIYVPDWAPINDPALMGLRALDVGTASTPVVGQPSQAGLYVEGEAVVVFHPGPLHYYLMAGPVRLLGAALAMPLVSVAIVGACLALTLWAVFRQLGRLAAVLAALVLGLITFTTGASSLVNPVSSNIAGYPLLCTVVLAWCVSAGDIRLLPLAAVVASFTAQQHLSVGPATAVVVAGALAVLAVRWARAGHHRDPASRRALTRSALGAAAAALVLWAPVLAQQAFGDEGNLGQIARFATRDGDGSLGIGSALRQVAHAVGLPPMLGRADLTGAWLLTPPSVLTWVSAAAVLATVAALWHRWAAAGSPRATLGPMVAVALAAGLVNGSSVPRGPEQARLAFYHWAFPLVLLVLLVLGLALADLVAGAFSPRKARHPALRPVLAGLAVVAVAAPTVVNANLDRRTNTQLAAYAAVERDTVEALADAATSRDGLVGDHTLLVGRHEPLYAGIATGLALELAQRGAPVKHPLSDRFFVADERLARPDRLDGGLVLVVDRTFPGDTPPGGELLARVDLVGGIDHDAYRSLADAVRSAGEVRLGATVERALADLDPQVADLTREVLVSLPQRPELVLGNAGAVAFLRDHPLEHPALDPDALARLAATLDRVSAAETVDGMTALRLYHLDRTEMLDYALAHELGPPDD